MAGSSQRTRLAIGIAVSLFFLYLTVFKPQVGVYVNGGMGLKDALFGSPRFNFGELGKVIRGAKWGQILIAGVIFIFSLLVRAWRWRKILSPLVKMPFAQVFGAMNIGYMANNVLPLRLGEVYKAQVVHQLSGLSRTEAFGTIVAERLVDLVYMVPVIGLAILMYPLPGAFQIAGLVATAGALLMSGFCVWLGLDYDRAMRAARTLLRALPEPTADKLSTIIGKFASGLGVLGRRGMFWSLTISSLCLWAMYATMVYLILDCLGLVSGVALIEQNVVGAVLVIMTVSTFGFVMPGAPGAVGTYHGVTVLGLSLFGVPGDRAVGFALMLHALNWLPLTLLGWAFFWKYGLTFKQPSAGAEPQGRKKETLAPAKDSPR